MSKIKLVVADKKEIFREGLVKILESEPRIEVVCKCSTELAAIKSIRKHRPDVILIDAKLSEYSSIELVQHIHREFPKTIIIVLTYSEAYDNLAFVTMAGATAYLSKNVSINNLIESIILAAEGAVVISPPMAASLLAEFKSIEDSRDPVKLVNLLSKQEQTVLSLVAHGFTNKKIATTLFVSENTVKVHLRNIMEKLNAHTRQQAVSLVGGKVSLPKLFLEQKPQV